MSNTERSEYLKHYRLAHKEKLQKDAHDRYQREKVEQNEKMRLYTYTYSGKLHRLYSAAQQRVRGQDKHAKTYFGMSICTRQQFLARFADSVEYFFLYESWKDSGFQLKYSPSLDRIDSSKGYTIDNIQLLTQSENRRKGVHSNSFH